MVILTESVDIPAPYEKLEAWADHFQEEFVKWSPYHIECEMYDSNARCMTADIRSGTKSASGRSS